VEDREQTIKAFKEAVNMTAKQIEKWLQSDDSKRVGQTREGEGESVGHQSGRRIAELLGKKADYSDGDLAHMRKVVGYVHRHMAQRPGGDVAETDWRYSLMNWGHDPLKES
jgi:Protein of unknown function (DUF3140)